MKITSSILAGVFAATAGAFGKFGFQSFYWGEFLYYEELSLKIACIIIMLVLNSLMIKFFMQSLKDLGASKATVINFTCNYMSSAVFGYLVYSEYLSLTWGLGALLMIIGVYIISKDN
ncbi:unnamed protein product [Blepharisma stoltei]|uniref:EamA domain-containing protein n=1 Tax=Blepharisma stoltei TaxID=1481888 RepID=A0AAU9I8D7_9CILI|nr:unnamed protein product [Blepharisma stoltei]